MSFPKGAMTSLTSTASLATGCCLHDILLVHQENAYHRIAKFLDICQKFPLSSQPSRLHNYHIGIIKVTSGTLEFSPMGAKT
eukprot:100658-Pelagomonas_calceolata.AAC.1